MKIIKFIFNIFAFIIVNIAFLTLIFFLIMGTIDLFIDFIPKSLIQIIEFITSENVTRSIFVYFKFWDWIISSENNLMLRVISFLVFGFLHLIVWQLVVSIFYKIRQLISFIFGDNKENKND